MTIRLADDRPIATVPAAFRVVARVVLAQGKARGLLAFGAADDHLHAVLKTDRPSAGAFAHYVETSLRWQLGLGARFERGRIRPLQDQRHAYNAFHYAHRQDARHGLHLDRAREATSLPDLLGLRLLEPTLISRVRRDLPRLRREELIGQFPPGALDDAPAADLDLGVLAEAAAATFALPHLRVRSVEGWRARRAAVHAAGREVPAARLSECLGLRVRVVQSLRSGDSEPDVTRAVEKQARLLVVTRT